ncbi:MAG TPA: hypothetical protein DCO83_12965 [Mucilaginibacter sp.]|jgi:hypothetical protein|nr:hypothetical protein [Mucilaginibacter sp.]
MAAKTTATALQKETFKLRFAEIIKNNTKLRDQYSIQFFETAQKSNYVIYGLNGKTINILEALTLEEAEKYKILKSDWQN